MNELPIFETKRLILRGVTLADAPSYTKYFVDYEIIGQLTASIPWPYPESGVIDFITNQILPHQGINKWTWGIFLKSNPYELIGLVDLRREGTPGNRGFWLGRPFWGYGYMTEAIIPITDYAYDHLGFEKLIFSNALGNVRSRKVKEKMGATLQYKAAKSFVNPKYTEHEIWELSKQNWQLHRKTLDNLDYVIKQNIKNS